MKIKKENKIILILFIILFLVFTFRNELTNIVNTLFGYIYFTKTEDLIIDDDVTSNYISYLEKEINEYKKINSLDSCINATVIYRIPSYWYDEVTINIGKNKGINEGDMVINNEGVVGSILKVYEDTAIISLLTSLNENKKITLAINDDDDVIYGILSNYNKVTNEIVINELTSEINYKDNLNVTTTSFTNTFKDGIFVGKVTNIVDEDNGLSKKAYVKPAVDYNNLKHVCVVSK